MRIICLTDVEQERTLEALRYVRDALRTHVQPDFDEEAEILEGVIYKIKWALDEEPK
jgi:hypothetical protein